MMSTQQTKASVQILITLERAQKLDLLIHLISNLSQSLVICGPKGIGKTKLLQTLASNHGDQWPICILQGSSGLSFESALESFSHQLMQQQSGFSGHGLSDLLVHYQKNNRKVVLVIDDAGLLVPGLISSLIQYANANDCLRLVLALTHDELHIKTRTDVIIDECHFIEIPPLNKKQCMTFLQNLSAQPGAAISFNAVTDALVDNLYSETHGIPGRIHSELPRLSDYEPKVGMKWGLALIIVFVGLFSSAMLYLQHPARQQNKLPALEPLISDKVAAVDISSPVIQVERNEPVIPPIKEAGQQQPDAKFSEDQSFSPEQIQENNENIIFDGGLNSVEMAQQDILNQTELEDLQNQLTGDPGDTQSTIDETPEEGEAIKPVEEKKFVESEPKPAIVSEEVDKNLHKPKKEEIEFLKNDIEWIRRQRPNDYTMQLMVLSQESSVLDLLKKYQSHRDSIKYFRLDKPEQKKFVVVYGRYDTSAEAEKAKKTLPAEFRKAWVRTFKALQQQISTH